MATLMNDVWYENALNKNRTTVMAEVIPPLITTAGRTLAMGHAALALAFCKLYPIG